MKGKSCFFLLIFFFSFFLFPQFAWSADAFVTIVHPIRNRAYWSQNNISHLVNQAQLTSQHNLAATWLVQYEALKDKEIVSILKNLGPKDEVGLLLEVSESLATSAFVPYIRGDGDWARPDKAFFSGYTIEERKRLVDRLIRTFEASFGYKPKSVGAWYIDAQTLSYLQDRYGIEAVLVCSDQYSTDSYETWGKYFGVPYYPAKKNSLMPSQTNQETMRLVVIQWALRDPLHSYGKVVHDSTYSMQANDYVNFHNLDTDYFRYLFDVYRNTKNGIAQITVGLEVGTEDKFFPELKEQIEHVANEQKKGSIQTVTMQQFASEFRKRTKVNQNYAINMGNPRDKSGWVLWYMTPYYRVGLFVKNHQLILADLKVYDEQFSSIDSVGPDKRHILYRSVSSIIDDALFGNAYSLVDNVYHIDVDQSPDGMRLSVITQEGQKLVTLNQKTIMIDEKVILSQQQTKKRDILKEFMNLLASRVRWPEMIRYSTIDGRFTMGISSGHDSVLGFQLNPFYLGSFTFDFQTLSRFKSLPPPLPLERFIFSDAQREAQDFLDSHIDLSLRVLPRTENVTRAISEGKKVFENEAVQIWKLP